MLALSVISLSCCCWSFSSFVLGSAIFLLSKLSSNIIIGPSSRTAGEPRAGCLENGGALRGPSPAASGPSYLARGPLWGGRASGRWSPATVAAAEVLESGWLAALLANFCPAPTRAHHPRLRPQPLGPARESVPCRGRGSKEREWNWAASQKSECVCKLVFFAKAVWHLCVWNGGRGGEGGSVGKEQDPFFLPGPRLPAALFL